MTGVPWPARARYIAALGDLQRVISREMDRAQTGDPTDVTLPDACTTVTDAWEAYARLAVRPVAASKPPPAPPRPQMAVAGRHGRAGGAVRRVR